MSSLVSFSLLSWCSFTFVLSNTAVPTLVGQLDVKIFSYFDCLIIQNRALQAGIQKEVLSRLPSTIYNLPCTQM